MTAGISIQPSICHGKPVIKGTRVLVSTILGALAGGDSMDMISEDYDLTTSQIMAALEFAANVTDFQTVAYDGVT
ncbi:MAG: DUF433 domain-containing protein [Terrimicrobiaceae bacterium]